ncbi:MAG: DMT family transporter [Erysipelotrichaceae bacterium]|nr:DMT family transporter [Erysipelotrichaceae bacterium]MDY5251592.1 DMT family transporter [Erysipelotrichaceae bacterium]
MRVKGIIYVLISALIYGFTPVLCSMTYKLGNTSLTLTFFRSFFVLPILIILMKKEHVSFYITRNDFIKIFIVALFGAVFTTLLLYSSYQYIAVGTATTLHFLYPLFVTLICHFIYHDNLRQKQIIALIISLFGVVFFMDFKDLSTIQGIMMALISGFTFSIYLVGIEKFGLSTMNSYKLSFYIAASVCFCLAMINIFTGQINLNQPKLSYALMVLIAILAQFVAVILLKEGIAIIGSSLASLFSMIEPVSSVIFGSIFLAENISYMQIIGCVMIMAGVIILLKK